MRCGTTSVSVSEGNSWPAACSSAFRSDVVLIVSEADDQRRVEARADEKLGVVAGEHGQRVRAFDALQGGPDGGQEVALVVGLDEVRNDLRVGVGREFVAGRLQLRLPI